ncbi:zinc-dependent metalloprotease [Grimontia kaedaensis]|uniref:Zinc-dependent metalloprotease n=1 Tax=Grimontia kaedaensis TaxID=2872157 RepID=A0ABY4WPG6_9GAMM|nr:zinc-dependent metalloprotease [Grimontia kaedaensis]USH01451.1 zinc-dependent metalloprotease [Grimontia kaedaensis]
MKLNRLLLSASIAAVLAGCGADDQEYQTLETRSDKERAISEFKEGRWLYVPTTGAAPRFALSQFPFLQGVPKLVELCFSESALEVRQYDKNYPNESLSKDANGFCNVPTENSDDENTNFPVVVTVPGDFAAYRCKEDSYGDCTNSEEQIKDGKFSVKSSTHFTPKFVDTETVDINYVELFGVKDGLTEVGDAELIHWEFDPSNGVINFELERTFSVNLDALDGHISYDTKAGIDDILRDGGFKSRFFYSLVHEDMVKSNDYTPVLYPVNDENEIGFFTSSTRVIDPVTNKYSRDAVYLNRFNPSLPSIDYYLSDNFFEPENKIFLDATIETVDKMNKTLSLDKTGVPPIRLVNPASAEGVHPGDLRYNVINLVDEPLDNGLLGYGPSVAHPLTGEIVKAHVNQYSGVARTGVKIYWDNMARVYNRGELSPGFAYMDANGQIQSPSPEVTEKVSNQRLRATFAALEKFDVPAYEPSFSEDFALSQVTEFVPGELAGQFDDKFENIQLEEERRLDFWARNSMYPLEASWVSSTTKAEIDRLPLVDDSYFVVDETTGTKRLKYWHELPEDVKPKVADAITVTTYANTFVHEIGHNLGLRHNFKASNDKANFFTEAQSRALGMNAVPAYSSTMDYAPSMLDETPTWGLYDLAAFKFGYGRQVDVIAPEAFGAVDTETGALVNQGLLACTQKGLSDESNPSAGFVYTCDLDRLDAQVNVDYFKNDFGSARYGVIEYLDSLDESTGVDVARKDYAFCTDGNVSLNSDCNRFDEGTTREEIATYYWQNYLDSFDRRNTSVYRDGRLYNSDYPSYIVRRYREMNEVREMLEHAEMIDGIFRNYGFAEASDKPLDFIARLTQQSCTSGSASNAWYCDYGLATERAAQFMLDVMATPEHQCLITTDGQQRVASLGAVINLGSFMLPSNYQVGFASCFDAEIKPLLEDQFGRFGAVQVIAETENGRFLNSTRSVNPDVPYSNAVSALGMWPDKLIATHVLARRYTLRWTDDGDHSSLMDWPGVKAEFDNIVNNLLSGAPLTTPVKLVDANGNDVTSTATVDVNLHKTQLIESLPPSRSWTLDFFGVDTGKRQSLAGLILNRAAESSFTSDLDLREKAVAQRASYSINSAILEDIIPGDPLNFSIANSRYFVTKANSLAYEYASQLVGSNGYTTKSTLDNYAKAELSATYEQITTAYGDMLGILVAYRTPVTFADSAFINDAVAALPADWSAAKLGDLNTILDAYLNAAIESGDVVYDKANATMSFKGGSTHSVVKVVDAIKKTYELLAFGYRETLLSAVDAYSAGYASATAEQKVLWDLDYALLGAYVSGNYDAVAGEYYKVLSQMPVLAEK